MNRGEERRGRVKVKVKVESDSLSYRITVSGKSEKREVANRKLERARAVLSYSSIIGILLCKLHSSCSVLSWNNSTRYFNFFSILLISMKTCKYFYSCIFHEYCFKLFYYYTGCPVCSPSDSSSLLFYFKPSMDNWIGSCKKKTSPQKPMFQVMYITIRNIYRILI